MPPSPSTDLVAVLDACVLFPASLRDTLLRLAETPRLYIPKWSGQIWSEVTRNLEGRRRLTPAKIAHLVKQIEIHFPEARVEDYEKLADLMTNHPKDRHVLAAAAKVGASVIVTSNLKDFPAASLREWKIKAQSPDDFLLDRYALDPTSVALRLHNQAQTIGRSLPDLLTTLCQAVPGFVAAIASDQQG